MREIYAYLPLCYDSVISVRERHSPRLTHIGVADHHQFYASISITFGKEAAGGHQ